MLHTSLLNPKSIVVIGASNNKKTPGGSVLNNLLTHKFKGDIYAVNPKETEVQGVKCYQDISDVPSVDLAIIAIAAKYTLATVRTLCREKNTRGFIIFSAGFSEKDTEGAALEKLLCEEINTVNGSLLGPNNIGLMNSNYAGVFTQPIPKLDPKGVDFISGSGATAVFIIEAAMASGLTFSSVFSVGNSAQLGVEEVLEHLDETFDINTSSTTKLLYIESISNPQKLLKHAKSLIAKGCNIAAIKAGSSEDGSRAASSHTGALASSDLAVDALFRKAGIIRCHGRNELISVASIFSYRKLTGKNIAIITHAGGPAVMLTDVLSKNGLSVPEITNPKSEELLTKLYPGSSVTNPIDFLATGTAEQLSDIIDYCEHEFDEIDAMVVIFGSPGLFEVYDVYDVLSDKINSCRKPIYPVLPSVVNVKDEINYFINKGHINFSDEVDFGNALAKVYDTNMLTIDDSIVKTEKQQQIRSIIDGASDGYLTPENVKDLLIAADIPMVQEKVCYSESELLTAAVALEFPLVMKSVGPIHKSDIGGVVLNITNNKDLLQHYYTLLKHPETTAVLIQQMKKGMELFIGAKKEGDFGHLVFCGLGGIFIEVLKDVQCELAPFSKDTASEMIQNLKAYPMLKGIRNQEGVDIEAYASITAKIASLVTIAPEISELDLNPLLGEKTGILTVDARICIEK
ncbi:MAG: acetate--CoA ligase family protein [Flavobacteriaceae bacterium]|nr:acetate--CoA ligase family protein [Flavobacteriaceae bacterium]